MIIHTEKVTTAEKTAVTGFGKCGFSHFFKVLSGEGFAPVFLSADLIERIEIIVGLFAAYRACVGVKQHIQHTFDVGLHFGAGYTNDIGTGNCVFGYRRLRDDAEFNHQLCRIVCISLLLYIRPSPCSFAGIFPLPSGIFQENPNLRQGNPVQVWFPRLCSILRSH